MAVPAARPIAALERICRGATSSDALAERAGAWLADACRADAYVFLRLDPLSALWLGGSDRGYPPESCAVYTDVAFLRSPFADFGLLARGSERVVRASRAESPRDPYTEAYLHGFGFVEELHVSFAHEARPFGHLTVARREQPFDAGARSTLEAAVTPVTQALRRLLAKDMLEAIPGERVGLIAVDRQRRLRGKNEAGESMRAVFERTADFRMRSALDVVATLAARALEGAGEMVVPRVVYVCPETQRRYRLLTERLLQPDGEPSALIIAEPVRALDSVELLRTAGLTEREAEVAIVTLRGFRSAEGATALQMSEHTFLSHLKVVYRKLGVGSRGELAALLLGGL